MLHYCNEDFLKPASLGRIQEAGGKIELQPVGSIYPGVLYLMGLLPEHFHSEPLLT